jgi:cell division septation protein DedD
MTTADDGWNDPSARELAPEPDFRPIPRSRPRQRRGGPLVFAAVLVIAIGAGASGWYFLHDGTTADSPDAEVPLIRADAGPIKVRPEEPGGMDVPDRDKLVYDRIDGNGERPAVERLLPPPEMPMAKPAPQAAPNDVEERPAAQQPSPAPASPPASTARTDAAPAPEQAVPSVEDVLTAMRPPPPIEPKAPENPAETKLKAEAAKAAVAPAKAGGFLVQLAAVRSREQADVEWQRLRQKNSDLLGNLDLSVMRADLGPDKGVFFRLRAGPVTTEAAAQTLCQKLSERKIGCLVVRPEG